MKLVLFDIDGTLMDSGGAGTRSLENAFRDVFSFEGATYGVSMAGKTDIQIVREILVKHGLPNENGTVQSLIDAYVKNLGKEINNREKRLKPGVNDILKSLRSMAGVHVGLLTGNVEKGAEIKLGAFGLFGYFSLGGLSEPLFGAFGSDSEDRNRLLPIATAKFKTITGINVGYGDCVVVGDTPKDIACAAPYGAFSVTVATGPYSSEELEAAGADVVLEDFTEERTMAALIA
jgi:phosphoglycolate phosphatase-like HAD superfamily hydrolase